MTHLSTTVGRRLACLSSLFLFKSVCLPSDSIPSLFTYSQSTLQAFYFFGEIRSNGQLLSSDDWVGAFKCLNWGEGSCIELGPCVGGRQWDTSVCGGGLCDVPVMGNDGGEYSVGYMIPGEVPAFLIYISATDQYHEPDVVTKSSGDVPLSGLDGWANNGFFMYESMRVDFELAGCMESVACNYDSTATSDSGLCEYAQENFDCDGNCLISLDCNGHCGGDATFDDCGVCGGDSTTCSGTGEDSSSSSLFEVAPFESSIISAYPNPFNPSVNIDCHISTYQNVLIYILDASGREVGSIDAGHQAPGRHQFVWHPESSVASGLYHLVLSRPDGIQSKAVTLIK